MNIILPVTLSFLIFLSLNLALDSSNGYIDSELFTYIPITNESVAFHINITSYGRPDFIFCYEKPCEPQHYEVNLFYPKDDLIYSRIKWNETTLIEGLTTDSLYRSPVQNGDLMELTFVLIREVNGIAVAWRQDPYPFLIGMTKDDFSSFLPKDKTYNYFGIRLKRVPTISVWDVQEIIRDRKYDQYGYDSLYNVLRDYSNNYVAGAWSMQSLELEEFKLTTLGKHLIVDRSG